MLGFRNATSISIPDQDSIRPRDNNSSLPVAFSRVPLINGDLENDAEFTFINRLSLRLFFIRFYGELSRFEGCIPTKAPKQLKNKYASFFF